MTTPQSEQPGVKTSISGPVLTGILALMAALVGAAANGFYNARLERQRFQSELVLRALQSTSLSERVASLQFMLRAHLITDDGIASGLKSVIEEKDSTAIPQIASVGTQFPSPVVKNARVFLLSGVAKSVPVLDSLREDITRAGYSVVGTTVIRNDDSRPNTPEVTYFAQDDSTLAEAIAAMLRVRFANSQLSAKRRVDAKVKPGYVEIWLGK